VSFSHSGRALRDMVLPAPTSLRQKTRRRRARPLWNQCWRGAGSATACLTQSSFVLIFTNTQILALKREGTPSATVRASLLIRRNRFRQWVGQICGAWAESFPHRRVADKLSPLINAEALFGTYAITEVLWTKLEPSCLSAIDGELCGQKSAWGNAAHNQCSPKAHTIRK